MYLENLANRYVEECFKNQSIRNHLDWYALDEFSGTVSDQQIDYYLNDRGFKELAMGMSYAAASLFGAVTNYRVKAIDSYFIIEDLLGDGALEPTRLFRRTSLIDANQANNLIGNYRLIAGPENTAYGKEMEVSAEGKQLYDKRRNENAELLHAWRPDKLEFFTSGGRSLIIFSSESSDKITIVNGTAKNTIWKKH